jgi:uncharacterized protein YdhG (YjbR/CyaY superfamily)
VKKPKNVDEYILNSSKESQKNLKIIREVIKKTVPQAEEKISYGMPYYEYKGRLVYFRLAKKHIGLYIPPPIIENFSDKLKDYVTAKSTIQFPLEKKLPINLIKQLVKARAEFNSKRVKL